jgi:preprotein translocase YajC subunit
MSQNINSIGATAGKTNIVSIIPTAIFLLMLLGLIFWTNYQKKQDDNKKQLMLNQLKEGDMVQTYSGIVGTISFISEDRKIIEIKTGINFNSKISINIQSIDQKIDNLK